MTMISDAVALLEVIAAGTDYLHAREATRILPGMRKLVTDLDDAQAAYTLAKNCRGRGVERDILDDAWVTKAKALGINLSRVDV